MSENKLVELINDLVNQKLLTAEGLSRFTELKNEVEALTDQVRSLKQMLKKQEDKNVDLTMQVSKTNQELHDFRLRESGLITRETRITDLELQAKYADLRRQDAFTLIQTVFKNPIVRETVMRSGNTSSPNGYQTDSATTTIEKEVIG